MYLYISHQARRRSKRVRHSHGLLTLVCCLVSHLNNPLASRTTKVAVEDDEEAQLRALQAELAM